MQAALSTGMADAVPAPEDAGPHLERFAEALPAARPARASRGQNEIDPVLERINVSAGSDFQGYETNTIYRWIEQRIAATRSLGMAGSLNFLDENHEEIQSLAQNCLLSATSLFRDKGAFEELEHTLAQRIPAEGREPLRAWAAGCETGEEAYTLSILFFAADLEDSAIAMARKAAYAAQAVRGLAPEVGDSEEGEEKMGSGNNLPRGAAKAMLI